MKKIPLSQGKFALLDAEDFSWLNEFKWHAVKDGTIKKDNWYVARSAKDTDGKRKKILMHRIIIDAPRGIPVDHINGDGLDNRRANIRICTLSQNQWNQKAVRGKSKFKGVSWRKNGGKWVAQITVSGANIHLGLFSSEIEAAKAYDIAALEHFGGFAKTNKQLGLICKETAQASSPSQQGETMIWT